MHKRTNLAILVGGGPAPGINSVIGAATIRAALEGVDVLGIRDGFEWIMHGNIEHVQPLTIEAVSRIHFRGGSFIGISRANPTKDPSCSRTRSSRCCGSNVAQLITIGGDDTAFSAMRLEEQSAGRIHVVHVPKTIDNDLDLPLNIDTFGFQTARHIGVEIVKNLMVDAQTTSRWYFVIAMGRKAGHLALGIGKAAGATLTLIPEEFGSRTFRFKTIVDTLVGAIIKRLSRGRRTASRSSPRASSRASDPADLAQLEDVERDAHGHLRIAEVDIGEILKRAVQERLREFGLKTTVVAKNIGYELRCADPIPYDMEYCRDLGYCAAKYLIAGGNAAMVSMQGGHFVPIPFSEMLDPTTGRDARALRRHPLDPLRDRPPLHDPPAPRRLRGPRSAALAAAAGLHLADFRDQFEYVVENEPPPLVL